jgi:hypothetical protein
VNSANENEIEASALSIATLRFARKTGPEFRKYFQLKIAEKFARRIGDAVGAKSGLSGVDCAGVTEGVAVMEMDL